VPHQGPVCLRFSSGISNIHSGSPLFEQCIIMHLPALYVNKILPDIQLLNIQQVLTFLVETILLLHVEAFQPTFFVERKYIEYWILIWDILLLIKGEDGPVYSATYPISTVSVIDVSSGSTCTCLCGMKAPDGVFCLFEKLYNVLLRQYSPTQPKRGHAVLQPNSRWLARLFQLVVKRRCSLPAKQDKQTESAMIAQQD